MSATSSYLTPKSRKNNMRGSSLFVITAFLLLQLMQTTYGNMLAFRNLCMVRGPIEGTDKKGHALVVEKLGVVGDGGKDWLRARFLADAIPATSSAFDFS